MQLLCVEDLAKKLNVKESWIRCRLLNKQIPFLKIGRHIRFVEDEINRWISLGCPPNCKQVSSAEPSQSSITGSGFRRIGGSNAK